MNRLVSKLLDVNAIAFNQDMLRSALADVAERFDFTGYAFVKLLPGQSYTVSNLLPSWHEKYQREDLRSVDPVIRRAHIFRKAFIWSGEPKQGSLTEDERRFYAAAAEYGIRSGVSFPIKLSLGALAILTFASAKPEITSEAEIDPLTAASAVGQLYTRFELLLTTPTTEDHVYLNPREATYVRWLSEGLPAREIAEMEHVKYNSVRITLDAIKLRYNLRNNTQLAALAVRRRLV